MNRIYLDNNATTQVTQEVLEEMLPFFSLNYGNPSSIHLNGQKSRVALDKARIRVAAAIGARPDEIIFTASGTESDNLAINGLISHLIYNENFSKPHVITSAIEHKAVSEPCRVLAERGLISLSVIAPDSDGLISPYAVKNAVTPNTKLISIMAANNETGVIQPLKEIADFAASNKIFFHSDAVQAVGKIPVNVQNFNIDMLSFSGHKIHAPKGIGVLYLKRGVKLAPVIFGASHEKGLRPGTENVPAIVAIGKAVEIAVRDLEKNTSFEKILKQRIIDVIKSSIPDIRFNGDINQSVPNTINVSFKNIEAEALLARLDMKGISISTGSACSSGASEPSRILKAMNVPSEYAYSAVRISLSHLNTAPEIETFLAILSETVSQMRKS